jgi:two-component system, OmpR family, sensor histidine kinase VicK
MGTFSTEWAAARWFTLRSLALLGALDQIFGIPVVLVYVGLVAGRVDELRWLLALGGLHVAFCVLRLVVLGTLLRPVRRWLHAPPASRRSGPLLAAAGAAAFELPLRYSVVQALTWTGLFPLASALLFLVDGTVPGSAKVTLAGSVLFGGALGLSAFALHVPMWGYVIAETAGEISLTARSAGEPLPGVQRSLRQRTITLVLCLTLAPLVWVVSYMVLRSDVRVHKGPAPPGIGLDDFAGSETLTVASFFLAVILWAWLCARFLAGTLATPVVRLAQHVSTLTASFDAKVPYAPVSFRDETGALAAALNDTIDELHARARRIADHEQKQVAARRKIQQMANADQRRAAELEAILNHVVELVAVCDVSRNVVRINRDGLRMLGLPSEAVLPAPLGDLAAGVRSGTHEPIAVDDLPLARALRGEVVHGEELILAPRGAPEVHVRATAAPILDEGGGIVGAVTVARDVSDEKVLALFKSQFIRVAAHELKTPVAVVKANAQLLQRYPGDAQRTHAGLSAIDRGADRIHRIILDLLEITQLELGTLRLVRSTFDLGEDLASVVSELSAAWPDRHVTLDVQGKLEVTGDRERLRHVAFRIVQNALKHSDASEPVGVRARADETTIVVGVTDRGIGIPAEKRKYIFQPFFRAHSDTAQDYGGFGVGLYIARELVRRHGGDVEFSTNEGRGTTFRIILPKRTRGEAEP